MRQKQDQFQHFFLTGNSYTVDTGGKCIEVTTPSDCEKYRETSKKIVIRILLFYALKERILRLVEGTPQKCALKIRVFLVQKKELDSLIVLYPLSKRKIFKIGHILTGVVCIKCITLRFSHQCESSNSCTLLNPFLTSCGGIDHGASMERHYGQMSCYVISSYRNFQSDSLSPIADQSSARTLTSNGKKKKSNFDKMCVG